VRLPLQNQFLNRQKAGCRSFFSLADIFINITTIISAPQASKKAGGVTSGQSLSG